MTRLFTLAIAIACLPQGKVGADDSFGRLSVVVADDVTASLLPPLTREATLCVLLRGGNEPDKVVHSRAYKLRRATHFIYRSESESPLSAIYRERLQNHGAIVIDLQSLSDSQLLALLKQREPLPGKPSGGPSLTKLSLGALSHGFVEH